MIFFLPSFISVMGVLCVYTDGYTTWSQHYIIIIIIISCSGINLNNLHNYFFVSALNQVESSLLVLTNFSSYSSPTPLPPALGGIFNLRACTGNNQITIWLESYFGNLIIIYNTNIKQVHFKGQNNYKI